MTRTYLMEVIKALPAEKRHEMALFLTSRHFNRGKNADEVERLFKIILDTAPEFSVSDINKEEIYTKLFGDSKLEAGRLEKVIYDLNKLLRSFVLFDQYFSEPNEEQQQIDWARWLRRNGIFEHSQKIISKMKDRRADNPLRSLENYRLDFLIAEEEHEMESSTNLFKSDLKIPYLFNAINLFFFNYKIELENRYLLQQTGSQLEDFNYLSNDEKFYREQCILLRIAEKINIFLKKDDPLVEDFYDILQLLQSNEDVLDFQTLAQYSAFLRSSCSLLINNGKLAFLPVLHNINQNNLLKGYFFTSGKLAPNAYMNLVLVAIGANDIKWAMAFAEQYKKKVIGDAEHQFFYRFSMAQCMFADKQLDQALKFLPDAPSSSHIHHMVRRLEIKIYYELQSDLLLYKIDAFRKFIVRTAPKTISKNLREMDLNFLNILTQITQSPAKDKSRSEKLIERIEKKKKVADRVWLLEKARELG